MFPNFGNLVKIRKNPLGFLESLARWHGDIYSFKIGFIPFVLINRVDVVKDVLVSNHQKFVKGLGTQRMKHLLGQGLLTSEGELHARQRRLMQPAFHREAIHSYGETMVNLTSRLCEKWWAGGEVDIAAEMRRLTLAIVAKALFSADVERESADIGDALNTAFEMFQLGMPVGLAKLLYRLPFRGSQQLKRAQARLDEVIYRIIREHRTADGRRRDVLTMLLEAQDVEGDGEKMNDRQVRDEALTLFLAGHETTAIALAWTWYLISTHSDAEARLYREVDETLGNRLPSVSDIPKLTYTRMVFTESLRLYPPAWVISRMAIEDHLMDGHYVAADTHVLISPYLLHRDPRYFTDPMEFRPERWEQAASRFLEPFSFIPFGAGPRNCIGESFAWMEGILIIATIAQSWRFRLVKDHPIEFDPKITLRPKYGVKVMLEAR